jgi:hypothetical protein
MQNGELVIAALNSFGNPPQLDLFARVGSMMLCATGSRWWAIRAARSLVGWMAWS